MSKKKTRSPKDKKIGYVGGVPRVNPPAVIRDEESRESQFVHGTKENDDIVAAWKERKRKVLDRRESRERQKDLEKHRRYTDPAENWSGLR